MSQPTDTQSVVASRYSAAAEAVEPSLCCPVDYDARYLKVIPHEVIERDYGCGDPSRYVGLGETVLDLGSGGGKICFIASQVVGASGRVIGVDMNDKMLQLARHSQGTVAKNIGYDNVTFLKGRIQDLAVDRDKVDEFLKTNPVTDEASLRNLESQIARMRSNTPMIADNSIDVVVSNCVLNLVDTSEKEQLFEEIFRVLKVGGRAVISDIVADQTIPAHLQQDPDLWSGCLSGAFRDTDFLNAFTSAGFYGTEMVALQEEPWQVIEGIEFRSATVIAYKPDLSMPGELEEELDRELDEEENYIVIYRGPFAAARDEFGSEYWRGEAAEVDRRTFERIKQDPYQGQFICIASEGNKTIQKSRVLPIAGKCC